MNEEKVRKILGDAIKVDNSLKMVAGIYGGRLEIQ